MRWRERESRQHHQPAGSQVHHVVVREVGVWASGASGAALSKVARRSERVGQTAYVIQLMMWPAACNLSSVRKGREVNKTVDGPVGGRPMPPPP